MTDPVPDNLCCFCKKDVGKYGNNPEPLFKHPAKCCDACNMTKVIVARIQQLQSNQTSK